MNTKCMRSWTNNTGEKERNSEISFQRPMGKYMNSKYVHQKKTRYFKCMLIIYGNMVAINIPTFIYRRSVL